jgi:hypothetical protein
MNSLVSILQTAFIMAQQTAQQQAAQTQASPVAVMWQHVTKLDVIEALTFISFGIVCLFYGWRIFKILVTICFGLLGLLIGIWANQQLIGGNVVWLAMICRLLLRTLDPVHALGRQPAGLRFRRYSDRRGHDGLGSE